METASWISRGEDVYKRQQFLNCRLFIQLLLDDPAFDKNPAVDPGKEKEGDVFQFGSNPGRHFALYLGDDSVMDVAEWGAMPAVHSLSELIAEYGPATFVYRPDKKKKKSSLRLLASKWKPTEATVKDELKIWMPWLWTMEDQILPLDEIISQTKTLFPEQVDMPIPPDAEFIEDIKNALKELEQSKEIEQVQVAYKRIASLRPTFRFVGTRKRSGWNLAPEFQALEQKYDGVDGVKITLSQSKYDKIITLDGIFVPKEKRKQGIGSAFMEELVRLADAGGYTLFLTPSKDFGGSSVARLRTFYGRFGFKRNLGRNKDFRSMNAMVRVPKKRASGKRASLQQNAYLVTAVATKAGAAMYGENLVLYHGTRLGAAVRGADAWSRGTLFVASAADATAIGRDSKIAGTVEVIAAVVDPSMLTVGGSAARPYFVAATRIPLVIAGVRDPYDREWGDETGPYPDDKDQPCVETEGKENPESIGGQGATAAVRKKDRTFPIKQDLRGLYVDVDGIRLRRYKGPAYRPDPFSIGTGVRVADSFLGPDYRMVKLLAAFEAWKVDKHYTGPVTASGPAVKKIRSLKTEEGAFSIWDIDATHKRPDMFTVWEHPDGWIIRNALVPEEMQRQGIATSFYKRMNQLSLAKTGKPLRSTQARTRLDGQDVLELSDAGKAMWDKYVEREIAEPVGDTYQFKRAVNVRDEHLDELMQFFRANKPKLRSMVHRPFPEDEIKDFVAETYAKEIAELVAPLFFQRAQETLTDSTLRVQVQRLLSTPAMGKALQNETPKQGSFAGPGEYLYHCTPKRNVQAIMRRGLKASQTGYEGPGVYFATTPEGAVAWTTFIHDDLENLALIRVRKDHLKEMYGLYSQGGKIQFGGADDDVLVGDETTIIPPLILEVVPVEASMAKSKKASADDLGSFEEWLQLKGGIEELAKQYQLEYWHEQAREDALADDPDATEEDIHNLFIEYVSDDLARAYGDWMYKYHHLLKFPLPVFRAVTLEDVHSLQTEGIGVYWTDSPSHAIAHWGQGHGSTYIIEGEVEEDAVDWNEMIDANMDPSLGQDEQEIRLKKGAKIKLTGYRKEVRSFGARGVWQPLEAEAVA